MKLILEQVKPGDVVEGESYLLDKDGDWIHAVATHQGWATDDAPDVNDSERKWPTMIFQCPNKGKLIEDGT